MKFKKILSAFFTGALTLSVLSISSTLAVIDSNTKVLTTKDVKAKMTSFQKSYAYLNYDSADAKTKDLILKARREVVFGNISWTVNGAISIKNADGSMTKLPEFKDLFRGWDLNQLTLSDNAITNNLATNVSASVNSESATSAEFSGNVYIPHSNGIGNTFFTFVGSGDNIGIWADTLPGSKITFGFKNVSTNSYLGWVANLALGQKFCVNCRRNYIYSVRCSTNDVAGTGWLEVQ